MLLLVFRYLAIVNVMLLFLVVPWVGQQCVVVVFPGSTHFLVGDEEEIQYVVCIFSKYGWLQDHFVDI